MRKKCKRHIAPYLPPNRYAPVDSAVVAHHWATVWLQWETIRTGDVYHSGHPSYEVVAATLVAAGYVLNYPRLKPNKSLDPLRSVIAKAQMALYHPTKRSLAEEAAGFASDGCSGSEGGSEIRFNFFGEEVRAIERAFVAFESVHASLPATDWDIAYKRATVRIKAIYRLTDSRRFYDRKRILVHGRSA